MQKKKSKRRRRRLIVKFLYIIGLSSTRLTINLIKNFEKWLSLTVHEPFFPGNLAQDPKFKIFFLHRSTLSSYHIIISYHHNISSYHIITSYHQVKNFEKWLSLTTDEPFFHWEFCPKTQNSKYFYYTG